MRIALFYFTLILMMGSCTGYPKSGSLEGTRPNIILVMTDDQGYPNLSCLGHPVLETPHIDELYTLSTRFTAFHVSPTCAPTRAAMMSGRHEFKNGVTHTIYERDRMSLETTTIIEVLKDAGYTSGIFGKWHLGDEDPYQPENRGFDEVFIHGDGGLGFAFEGSCGDFPTNDGEGRYFSPVIKHNGLAVKTKGFCTDVFFKQALGWIKSCKEKHQPFLAFISTNAPHGPMIAPDHYKQRFLELGYNETLSGYFGMIENIDDNMGLLLSKLKEWELEENTLLIFMSDNGQSAGTQVYNAGMKGDKVSPYEGVKRVPAFYYWKGKLTAGADIDRIAAHIDLFPTFAALAGAEIPDGIQQIDGRNLLPLLENPEAEWEDRYLFFHSGRWPRGVDPDSHKYIGSGVRNQRFRLVNNNELYDIENDPGEKVNVYPELPEVVKEMQIAYDAWWNELGPLMVNEDAELSPVWPFHELYYRQEAESGIPDWREPVLSRKDEEIETILEMIRTPEKQGQLVIAPSYRKGTFDSHAVDCPFPFTHEGRYWMTYVGWDGKGYQTGLASSGDLLTWRKEGLILGRGTEGSITEHNIAMTNILRDNELFGSHNLKRVDGRFVGTYHAYPEPGYEVGPAVIGLCYSDDLRSWEVHPPVLEPDPSWEWEAGGLYKSWLLESEGVYYIFYNAKNNSEWPWVEQTGFATSTDLINWERFPGNPVLKVGPAGDFDDLFASDPVVFKHGKTWMMFYFGLCSDGHARDGVAFSDDLEQWRKSGEILIDIGGEGSIDSRYAHKPGIITRGNSIYHFYCAVAPAPQKQLGEIEHTEIRGISLATK